MFVLDVPLAKTCAFSIAMARSTTNRKRKSHGLFRCGILRYTTGRKKAPARDCGIVKGVALPRAREFSNCVR